MSWKAAAGSKGRVREAFWRAREHWEEMRGRSVALLTQSCLTSLITQSVVRMRFAHPCLCRLIFITAGGKTEYSMATKLPSRTSLDFQLYPGAVCESCTSQTCLMVEKQTEVLDNSWLGGSSFGAWPGFQESLQCLRGVVSSFVL